MTDGPLRDGAFVSQGWKLERFIAEVWPEVEHGIRVVSPVTGS